MPKKPSAINAGTLLASKEKVSVVGVSGSLQRGQTATETLVDLNFKVPPDFRDRFKRHAFESRLKNVQLLVRALEAWERQELEMTSRKGQGRVGSG